MKPARMDIEARKVNTTGLDWRWLTLALILGATAATAVLFLDEVGISQNSSTSQERTNESYSSSTSLPLIELKSIQASPFQQQLIAQVLVDGVEQRVTVGQQLRKDLVVKSIDVEGLDLLHHQQLHRYQLLRPSGAVTALDTHTQAIEASVSLLSHEFRHHTDGVEVYSATQQGLSASLGLQNGDMVRQVNGNAVAQPEDIVRVLRNYQPRQVLEFVGTRQGQKMTWIYQAQASD